jgi:hypothetical protein
MKKLLFLFATVLLISCSSDDNGNPTTENSIVGKWQLTQILQYCNPVSGYTCNPSFDITQFMDNGNSTAKYADLDNNDNCVQFTDDNTYIVEGSALTETYSITYDYVYKYKIIELTNTSLRLELKSQTFDNGSDTDTYEVGEEIKVFSRMN